MVFLGHVAFLHVADSASHAGFAGPIGLLAAVVGVGAGAFVVFGLPAIRDRRRGNAEDIAGRDAPD